MTEARFLTHADRAQRRFALRRKLMAGRLPSDLAAEFGLSVRYVRQIAQEAGLSNPVGRPRGMRWWSNIPPHLAEEYDALIYVKKLPARVARNMLEAA